MQYVPDDHRASQHRLKSRMEARQPAKNHGDVFPRGRVQDLPEPTGDEVLEQQEELARLRCIQTARRRAPSELGVLVLISASPPRKSAPFDVARCRC